MDINYQKWLKGRCLMRCGICNCEKRDSIHFWQHVVKAHHLTSEDYRRDYPSFYVYFEFRNCRICGRKMKDDRGKMMRHLNKYHNEMTLWNYYCVYEQEE